MTMRIARPAHTSPLALIAGSMACVLAVCALLAASAVADTGSTATGGAGPGTSASSAPGSPSAGTTRTHKTSVATWFGPGLYGQKTACGQTLTPAVVGVANRTLPCGTLVKISYHGQTITVPVLDRGPYANGADWDLTAGAAQALGVDETVRIATHVVGATPNTPMLGLPPITPAEEATGGAQASG